MTLETEAMLEAYASCAPSVLIHDTLEFYHPTFAEPAYIVANVPDDIELGIEVGADFNSGAMVTFIACPLESPWPEQREGQLPTATVKIDNVNRLLVPKIRAALMVRAYIRVRLRRYLDNDRTEPAYGPVDYTLSNVVMTGTALTGMATVGNLQNKRFPAQSKNYTTTQFPSLEP